MGKNSPKMNLSQDEGQNQTDYGGATHDPTSVR